MTAQCRFNKLLFEEYLDIQLNLLGNNASDQRLLIFQGSGTNNGITQRHFSLLAQWSGQVNNCLSDWVNGHGLNKAMPINFLLCGNLVVAERFDITELLPQGQISHEDK